MRLEVPFIHNEQQLARYEKLKLDKPLGDESWDQNEQETLYYENWVVKQEGPSLLVFEMAIQDAVHLVELWTVELVLVQEKNKGTGNGVRKQEEAYADD